MKKILLGSLLVLLTICLFVGCSSSPNDKKTITFIFMGDETQYNVELDVSGCKTFGDLGTDYTFDVVDDLISQTFTYTYTDDIETENGFYFSFGEVVLKVFSDQTKNNRCNKNTIIENGKTYYGNDLIS